MVTVAFIPARGGSKGIKHKNLSVVNGFSLIERAIMAAKASKLIDRIVVSTDSPEISDASLKLGAEVVQRPAEISGDEASSESAIRHFLDLSRDVEIVAFLQATSPFIDAARIDSAIGTVSSRAADSVFSAAADHGFRWEMHGGFCKPIGHDSASRKRRQDLDFQVVETGAFYVFRRESFDRDGSRFCGRVSCEITDKRFAIEIDEPSDLEHANQIAKYWRGSQKNWDLDAVVLDFDGVQTDDFVYVDETGVESVRVSRADGLGIRLLIQHGVRVLVLSTEVNKVVAARAHKLKVELIQNVPDKADSLKSWASDNSLELGRIAFIGNDVNDREAMKLVGFPVAVNDAHPDILSVANFVLSTRGGRGAVREFAGIVLPVDSHQ